MKYHEITFQNSVFMPARVGAQGFCLKGPAQMHYEYNLMYKPWCEIYVKLLVLGAKLSIYSHFRRRPLNSGNQMSQVLSSN